MRMVKGEFVLHATALAVCASALPLLIAGGSVTSYEVGMAVPDWPTSMGNNMFLEPWRFPWLESSFGVLVEHGHRLLGMLVGLLAIGLTVLAWLLDRRQWYRWLVTLALVAICVQGILGGARVRLNAYFGRDLAMAHGILGQLTFGLLAGVAVLSSRSFRQAKAEPAPDGRRVRLNAVRLNTVLLLALVLVQIILGAEIRHWGHGFWPHLALAGGLLLLALWQTLMVAVDEKFRSKLLTPAILVLVLLFVQLFLGFGAYMATGLVAPGLGPAPTHGQAAVATLHVLGGALLLAAAIRNQILTFANVAAGAHGPVAEPLHRIEAGI